MKLTQGVHYNAVSSELSRAKTAEVLAALNRREILDLLERHPIERIAIVRTGGKAHAGEYDWREKTIAINSVRKLGVHYGAVSRPGSSFSMFGDLRQNGEHAADLASGNGDPELCGGHRQLNSSIFR